jgi:hypothetical protein
MKEKDKKPKDKYEYNIAEFPICFLSKSVSKEITSYEYQDIIAGKNGEIVPRKWIISPDANTGFPTGASLDIIYNLFQIWKEQGFLSTKIHFGSIYNLLKRSKSSTGKRDYNRVKDELDRLVGINIKAVNAFWDNEKRRYVDKKFHLFADISFYKEEHDGPYDTSSAWIQASDVLHGSVMKNSLFITQFDSEFFHKLKPIEKRLALYLSKMFRSQEINKRDLFELATQLPIYSKQKKSIKQRLKKACQGLLENKFKLLDSFWFEKGQGKQEYIVFKRKGEIPKLPDFKQNEINKNKKEQFEIDVLVEDILEVCQDNSSLNFYKKVARLVSKTTIYRALAEVREVRDLGEIKKSKGALFTNLIKKYGQEEGAGL